MLRWLYGHRPASRRVVNFSGRENGAGGQAHMEIDRRAFIASLGGATVVAAMTSEQKADALEAYMEEQLDQAVADRQMADGTAKKYPTMAEIEAENAKRASRRGLGSIYIARNGQMVPVEPLSAKPTIVVSAAMLSGFWNRNSRARNRRCSKGS